MTKTTEKISIAEYHARLRAQEVPREHLACKCVMCGTVQSMASLIAAGAGRTPEEVEKYFQFSCVGRFTNAGPHKNGAPPGKGCDWTLGGLIGIAHLIVIDAAGGEHLRFELATKEEAQALMNGAACTQKPKA